MMTPMFTSDGQPAPSAAEQERLFQQVMQEFGPALARFALGYEFDPDNRRDLLQEIHISVWRSLAIFDGRCSMRTWIYRIAHNTAVKYLLRQKRRQFSSLKNLEEIDEPADPRNLQEDIHRELALQRLATLIGQLKPLDQQIILLYVDGVEAESIAEITGLSRGSVGVKIHRIKHLLSKMFAAGG